MLCLHGYNTDMEVMRYQMRHFRQVFDEVMEFTFVNAPFECDEDPPKELLRFLPANSGGANSSARTKFRTWLRFKSGSSTDCVYGLEEVA